MISVKFYKRDTTIFCAIRNDRVDTQILKKIRQKHDPQSVKTA